MSGLLWLVSYPKSGNTWLRLLLSHLRRLQDAAAADVAAHSNESGGALALAEDSVIISDRESFERVSGLVSSELPEAEIDALRGRWLRSLAAASAQDLLLKVHDRFESGAVSADFPADCSRALLLIVRDPRDVCVSLAHHLGLSIEATLARMLHERLTLNGGRPRADQFAQWIGRWDQHTLGWLQQTRLAPILLRYEDLLAAPEQALADLCRQIGWSVHSHQIAAAVAHCRFERLAGEEAERGFAERPGASLRFFRAGRAGDWRERLSSAQRARIESEFGAVMHRLGYAG